MPKVKASRKKHRAAKPYERKDDDVEMKDNTTAVPVVSATDDPMAAQKLVPPHERHREELRNLHATIKQMRDKRDLMPKKTPADREARTVITKQCEQMLLDFQARAKAEIEAWEQQRDPEEAKEEKEKWLVNHRRRQKAWKTRKRTALALKN